MKRSREEKAETIEFDWVFSAADPADIAGFGIPELDEVVTLGSMPVSSLSGDWNIDDFKITGKEGDDLKGSGRVKRNNGAALPLLS